MRRWLPTRYTIAYPKEIVDVVLTVYQVSSDEESDDEESSGSEADSSASTDESESEKEEEAAAPKKRKAEADVTPVTKKAKTEVTEGEAEATGNLFVGNLSWNVDESWLVAEFEKFGELSGARVMTDKNTGRSRGLVDLPCYRPSYTDISTASAMLNSLTLRTPLKPPKP